jgi:hypothetical protein
MNQESFVQTQTICIRDMRFQIHDRDPHFAMLSTLHGGTMDASQHGISRIFTVDEAKQLRDFLNRAIP